MNQNTLNRRLLPGLLGLLGVLGLLQACGGDSPASAAATQMPVASQMPLTPPPVLVVPGTWVVLGSSSAFGAGATAGQGWAARLQSNWQASAVTVTNLANPGSVTYQALPSAAAPVQGRPVSDAAHNVDAALALKPHLLVVSYPSNDTALGYSVDETVRNVLAIRNAARSQNVAVVVLSTQPRNVSLELLQRMHQIDERLLNEIKGCFVPVHAALAGPDGLLSPAFDSGDGVHPSDAGHALIFDRIQAVLKAGDCVGTVP